MSFHFDTLKAVQATAILLKKASGQSHNYTAVIKMLYMADRESLAETESPITGDTPIALERGPILSCTLDLMKELLPEDEEQQALWSKYIRKNGYTIEMVLDPGDSELSDFEVQKLEQIFQDHGKKPFWQLCDETHSFQEWQETFSRAENSQIHLKTLLKALNMDDQYDELSTKQIEDAHFAKLFGS